MLITTQLKHTAIQRPTFYVVTLLKFYKYSVRDPIFCQTDKYLLILVNLYNNLIRGSNQYIGIAH